MQFIRYLASRIGMKNLEGAEFQESLDIIRALELSQSKLDSSYIRNCSIEKQRSLLQNVLIENLVNILATIRDAKDSSRTNIRHISSTSNPDDFPVSYEAATGAQTATFDAICSSLGYSVHGKQSTIPNAGNGAWVQGEAREGSIVGIYPGTVYLPPHLRSKQVVDSLYPDEHFFLYCRYDGVVIDARNADPPPLSQHTPLDTQVLSIKTKSKIQRPCSSPFGIAHLCNHPPQYTSPNVIALPCDIPSKQFRLVTQKFPDELLHLVPNIYHQYPSLFAGTYSPYSLMNTVVLMATRRLKDEEMFLDYRFSPTVDRPSWYHPVDPETEVRSWSHDFSK